MACKLFDATDSASCGAPGVVYVIRWTTTPTDSTDELFWIEKMTRKELAIERIKGQPFFGGKHAT